MYVAFICMPTTETPVSVAAAAAVQAIPIPVANRLPTCPNVRAIGIVVADVAGTEMVITGTSVPTTGAVVLLYNLTYAAVAVGLEMVIS